jgi:predicted transposase YbfD/YdcC
MAFDYSSKLTALYNVLFNANTTTASVDLSSGLDSRVKIVSKADVATVNLRSYEFPAVFIKIENKSEDFEGIGGTGSARELKSADLSFQVVGLYKKYGATTTNEDLLSDVYKLADNIESVIREEYTLSNTVSWCQPESTDFIGPFEGDGTLVKGAMISVKAKCYFR